MPLILYAKNMFVTLFLLTFICISIAFQLSFTLGSVGRIHSLVSSGIRSTVASVNNLIGRGISGILLIAFKFLLDDITLSVSFWIYLGVFVFASIPLIFVLRTPERPEAKQV